MSNKYSFMQWPSIEHKVPIMMENHQHDYIMYGLANEYPYYLLNMYKRSAKHNAIVNGKTQYIIGKGWTAKEDAGLVARAKAEKFMNNCNEYEDLNDLTEKLVLDLEIFNGFAVYVTWAKDKKSIARLEHCPMQKVRVDKNDKMFQVAEWYDAMMIQRFPSGEQVERVPAFDPTNRIGKQLFYYRCYSPGVEHYPLPQYLGGLAWIEADVEVANFHIQNLKNGFVASTLLNFNNGIPEPEEQLEIERQIRRKFTTTDNAGRIIVNFNDDPAKAPTIQTLVPSDLDKQFEMLNKTIQQEIFVAHNVVNPMLFGVKTEGQLGGRKELVEAYELFKNTYINDRQQKVERMVNYIASFNGVEGLLLQPTDPITEQLSEAAYMQVATPDEVREKLGLKVDEPDPSQPAEMAEANDNIKKLSGREYQNLQRIIREYNKGKLSLEQAKQLMKSGFALTEDDVTMLLGLNEQQFSDDDQPELLEKVASMFGVQADGYEVLSSVPFRFESEEQLNASEQMMFAVEPKNEELDEKILAYRKDNPRATVEQIADGIKEPRAAVARRIQYLISKDLYPIKRTIDQKTEATTEPTLEVRYRYNWAPEFKGRATKATSRKFCQIMMDLAGSGKLYSRDDINQISAIMGYSVWARRGGWYTIPNTDTRRPQCRHVWEQQLVMKKA